MDSKKGIDELYEHFDELQQGSKTNPNVPSREQGALPQQPGINNKFRDLLSGSSPVLDQGYPEQLGQQVYIPVPIGPPRKSPSPPSPPSNLLIQPPNPTTPTRCSSGYLEHITPLRFPKGQPTSSRRLSHRSTSSSAHFSMNNTAQGSRGVSDNSSSEDNGGVSMNFDFQSTGGASTGVNSQGIEGVSIHSGSQNIGASMGVSSLGNEGGSMHINRQNIGGTSMNDIMQSNTSAVMNDTTPNNTRGIMNVAPDDEQGMPRGIHSQAHVPVSHQLATGQPFVSPHISGGHGLRRMSSTPVMPSRRMFNPVPGLGSVHRPSHPAPTAPVFPNPPVIDQETDEVNEFFNTLKIMILEAVQVNRYKNGLFVTSITPHTDLMHDINILIASTQVTGLDNLRVQNVKAGVEEIKRRRASGHRISTTVMGRRMTIYDFYGQHVSELRDVLLSRDRREHARWLEYYGGGGANANDGDNGDIGGSGGTVA